MAVHPHNAAKTKTPSSHVTGGNSSYIGLAIKYGIKIDAERIVIDIKSLLPISQR